MNKTKRRFLSILLSLAMMLGMLSGMSLTAAAQATSINITFTEWTDAVAETQNGAGATAATSLPSVEGSYCLTADVTISGTWSVPGTTNLCLNGHSITRTGNGSVISIPLDSTLNLYDEEGDAGTITGGNTSKGGGVMINGGTLNMYGGKISGNKATSYGGGVCIDESGEFVMDGGTISDNDSSSNIGFGGGVCAYNGTFILKSGLISGNKAKIGGGVQVYYTSDTQFTMSGGAIQGNSALGQSYSARGGGIDIMRPFTMSGGKISGNYTDGQGGAMYVQSDIVINGGEIYGNSAAAGSGGIYNSNYNISISGNVLIKDNNVGGTLDGDIYTGGTVSNVNFSGTSGRFNITGALAQTASIGLTMKTPGVFTSSAEGINAIDYKDNFVSDDPELFIAKQEDGDELQLFRQPVSYLDENGEEQQCNVYTPVDKNTASWSNGWYFVNDSITINSYQASVSGTVNLILGDGATLTAEKGISVVSSYTLNVFVQSHGTSTGKLISTGADGQAGIGSAAPRYSSSNPSAGGTVNIYGGDITAIGGKGAAGIGGGARYNSSKQGCPGGTVNIYGGTVTATAGAADDAKGSAVAIGAGGSAEDHGTLTLGEGVKLETSTDGEIWTEATDTTTRTQYMKTSYTEPVATYDVSITAGEGMTKTTDSGEASQTGLTDAMTDVVYTANDGYYFPENYSVDDVNGISVTRDSYTQITVSGTPTANAEITLTAATQKTTPDAPTTAAATDCTTADNNDGKLTGVTTAMEYKKSDAEDWTAGTGSDITGLVPGTYYIRVKATDTTLASDNQELTIADYNTAAAKAVSDKIAALPAIDQIKVSDAKQITEAREAFDALTADQKAKIPNASQKKLKAVVAVLEAKEAQEAAEAAEAQAKKDQAAAEAAAAKAGAEAKAAKEAQAKAEAAKKKAEAAKKKAEAKAAKAKKATLQAIAKGVLVSAKGGKGKISVKWKALKGAKAYRVLISKNKKGTVGAKVYNINSTKKLSTVLKKLKKGTYYVRVRGFKYYKGNTVCGKYSFAKVVKVK